jgi:hypothetical protein
MPGNASVIGYFLNNFLGYTERFRIYTLNSYETRLAYYHFHMNEIRTRCNYDHSENWITVDNSIHF